MALPVEDNADLIIETFPRFLDYRDGSVGDCMTYHYLRVVSPAKPLSVPYSTFLHWPHLNAIYKVARMGIESNFLSKQ